jgi:DNA-binding beta-propeller fold protein YncE
MAAFVVGPTGLAYDAEADVLYVASTSDNEIFKILHAETTNTSVLKGILVFSGIGRALLPKGPQRMFEKLELAME